MDEKGSLGLFLSRDKAAAVWVSSGADASVQGVLNVLPRGEGEPATLALQAARAAVQRGLAFDEVFLAVDCGYYTRHNLHSEFDDYAQVESTIKYDAEEAAAADAMNLATAFEITGKDPAGSKVTVYAADRQLLTDILMDVQEGGLDPTAIEPDAVCLGRALSHKMRMAERTNTLFAVLSSASCYLFRPQPGYAPAVRTFLVGQGQNVAAVLAREILLLGASEAPQSALTSLVLVGRTETVDTAILHQRTGLEVTAETPEKDLALAADADGVLCHELLAAYGAALAGRTREPKADFRRDFMPFQGRRKALEGSLRKIGIALTVLLAAAAVFFQIKAFQMKSYARQLTAKTARQYAAVMEGKSPPPGARPTTKLNTVYSQIQKEQEGFGLGDETLVPSKLMFFFEALNQMPSTVDIRVQQITINERSMKVKGDAGNRAGTMVLLSEIKKHPRISLASERVAPNPDGRDAFEITLEPKKAEAKP